MVPPRLASIYRLFILACPKCRSEYLRQHYDHLGCLGCLDCGTWVFRVVDGQLVELDWHR